MEELYSKQFASTVVHKSLVCLEYVSGNCLIEGFEVVNETSKIFLSLIYTLTHLVLQWRGSYWVYELLPKSHPVFDGLLELGVGFLMVLLHLNSQEHQLLEN